MALSVAEQAKLDQIAVHLTLRDPELAAALSTMCPPPGGDATRSRGTMHDRIRSARTLFGLLGAVVLVWVALWGPRPPASQCESVGHGADAGGQVQLDRSAEPPVCNDPGRLVSRTAMVPAGAS